MAARRQTNPHSESVDDYLKAILALGGPEEGRATSTALADRLRVLISGRLLVETKTVTENIIGRSLTDSLAYPLPIKALDTD